MIQVACDITLYPGRWGRRKRSASWPTAIRGILRRVFCNCGRLLDVEFQRIDDVAEGPHVVVHATIEWWDGPEDLAPVCSEDWDCLEGWIWPDDWDEPTDWVPPADCADELNDWLQAVLKPEYENQIEVEFTVLSAK